MFLGIENILEDDLLFLKASAKNARREHGRTTGNATIDAIQHISVRAIDSTQTEIRFDRWFWNAVGADAWVSWEVNDCGEQTGSPADSAREYPICVQAMAEWKDGRKAYLWIAVGSGNEVRGKPELAYASAGLGDNNQRTFHSLAQFAKYAQIEGKLEESVKK